MNKYYITYTNNKHCYVKVEDGILHLLMPKQLKKNPNEHNRISQILFDKGKILLENNKNRKTITNDTQNIEIRGKKVSKNILIEKNQSENEYLQKELYEYIHPRVQVIAKKLGFGNIPVRINKVKSKRGSCSHDNRLMFNLLLVHLDSKYTDYVIVHECCHFVHKNHSQDFRNLVANYYPEYKKVRNEMKLFKFNN